MRNILIVVVALFTAQLSRSPLAAQQAPVHRIDTQAQTRNAAQLSAVSTRSTHSSMSMHSGASNARWIGAAIGAVALPLAAYVAFHDRDSGGVNTGGLLLIGAIGAVLGFIVGGIVHRD